MPVVRCLSFHAHYQCRHSGNCCTSRWPIPIERDRLERLRIALNRRQIEAVDSAAPHWIANGDAQAETPAVLGVTAGHACVFFDAAAGRTCRIHSALGHDALPLACRQFPRVSVIDPRGVSVTLSHFCPTAASLLDDPIDVTIVDAAPSFRATGEYVGLDARSSLPPLLRPGMLMDWDSWWECERQAVALVAD